LAFQLYHYIREAWKASRQPGVGQSFGRMLRLFPSWRRSLTLTPSQIKLPWISYPAIEMLEQTLKPDMRIFEWGVGGSTLFFASRVGLLVSVEHDARWAENVRSTMTANSVSWELFVVPPVPRENERAGDIEGPEAYGSAVEIYLGLSFRRYASVIDRFADGFFDLILVDGRSRSSCALHAISKVKPGGYLMVDDAERARYSWVHEEMRRLGWEGINFSGPVVCTWSFHQTGCWRRSACG
jgi:hypothetical protein